MTDKTYAAQGTLCINMQMTKQQLAWALFQIVFDLLGEPIDDAGCDWYTDDERVCIAEPEWIVCDRADVARLVDAANVLHYGHTLHLEAQST